MWTLWTLQKDSSRAASEIVNLRQWVRERTGFDGWWEALQLDRAVSWFGRYVESKLSETDKKGNPRYQLEDVLADEQVNSVEGIQALAAMFGVIRR